MNKLYYPVLVLATVSIVGCSQKVKEEEPDELSKISIPVEDRVVAIGMDDGNAGSDTGIASGAIPSERVVYFDYDSDLIRSEARTLLEAHAAYLSANPNVKIRLEGHADERGSREYNLALGERRAEAVKRMLNILGTYDGQLETLSYGEENPISWDHNERSWQLNRRVEFIYP